MEKLKSLLIVSGFILSLVVVIDGAVARTVSKTSNYFLINEILK